jgi:hypothetical protein
MDKNPKKGLINQGMPRNKNGTRSRENPGGY